MILLNWLLAFGALAFTVPLAIHLLFRNRFRLVDWGAMQFLESVVRLNRRRMQLRNLLLLLIRCAIPVLLAFCLARPVLTGWQQPRGDQPVAMVMVLDTSYSMSAAREDGARRIDAAVDAARQITAALARGSEITLLTSDAMVRTGDPQATGAHLDGVTVGGGPLELDALLSRALRIVSDSRLPSRQIVLLTDNAASDFRQSTLDALPAIGTRLRALAPEPHVAWVDPVGEFPQPTANRRITRSEPAVPVAVPGQTVPWLIEARVDAVDPANVDLQVRVNGLVSQQRTVNVRNGIATTRVPVRFDRVGLHAVEVSVGASGGDADASTGAAAARDDFPPDDRTYRDFRVIDPIGVWLVDGNPSARALESDTDFLAVALSPFALSRDLSSDERPADLFRTRKVREGRLRDDAADFMPQVVVLADVGRPSPAESQWIADFVQNRGGTLVVFAGASIDPQWYDMNLVSDGSPLLPFQFGDVQTVDEPLEIDDSRLTYPPLARFSDTERGTLSGVQVKSWRPLIARQQTATDAQIVARLTGGQPLIGVGTVGRGRVLQVATTADNRWTTLPLRPVFVPLMQRLLAHLAVGGDAQATRRAGEPIVLIGLPAESRWTVTTPDGQTHSVQAGDGEAETSEEALAEQARGRLTWPRTRLAGAYRFDGPDDAVILATVNVPEADLGLAAAEPQVRQDAARQIGATLYDSVDAYLVDDANRRFGRSVWHYVLALLLAAMILEPVVQQTRGRAE